MRQREQEAIIEATEAAAMIAHAAPSVSLNAGGKRQVRERLDSTTDLENAVKITITKEAAQHLKDFVNKANDGFEAGQVHRQDVASWVLTKFISSATENEVSELRSAHYNDATMLEAMYRRMKETGVVPDFLRDALRGHFASPEDSKKQKKALTRKSINDGLHNDGASS